MAPTTTTSSTEPTPRPSSRGAFELHVQSVRATRGLPHLVATPNNSSTPEAHVVAPPPVYVARSVPEMAYRPSDEKSEFESDADTIVVGELKPDGHNRRTSDDGPEPKTLARYLFIYGFLMPLFWVCGASILFLDLAYHQTPEELAEDPRTPEERKADLAVLRRAEVRWAWRSLYALIIIVLVVMIALLIWAGITGKFTGVMRI
jgi:hypothetical protein